VIDVYSVGIFGARILEYAGYLILVGLLFVFIIYALAHWNCMLGTSATGWEWGCAADQTTEIVQSYLRLLTQED
jgi:hypothetical protein